jgi:hypothetical protein
MPSDRFKPDQNVIVSHLQADQRRVQYHAKIVKYVSGDTWQIEVPALGLLMLMQEEDLRDVS